MNLCGTVQSINRWDGSNMAIIWKRGIITTRCQILKCVTFGKVTNGNSSQQESEFTLFGLIMISDEPLELKMRKFLLRLVKHTINSVQNIHETVFSDVNNYKYGNRLAFTRRFTISYELTSPSTHATSLHRVDATHLHRSSPCFLA